MVSTTANVLATVGTVCWCVQLIPQIIFNYLRKNTEGFPELMALLWCLCVPFFGVFVVSENSSIPIMIQPHLFGIFCLIIYIQVMYYPPIQRPKKQILIRAGSFLLFQIVIEISCIIPLRNLYLNKGIEFPPIIFGAIATVLIAGGLIPPYFEVWKRNGQVVGINFIFLFIDLSGAILSLASLAVDPSNLDIMGLVLYICCGLLELGLFISQGIWLIRFKFFKSSLKNSNDDSNDDSNDIESSVSNTEIYSIEDLKDVKNNSDTSLNIELTRNNEDSQSGNEKDKNIDYDDEYEYDYEYEIDKNNELNGIFSNDTLV